MIINLSRLLSRLEIQFFQSLMVVKFLHTIYFACKIFCIFSSSYIHFCLTGDHTMQQYSILFLMYVLNILSIGYFSLVLNVLSSMPITTLLEFIIFFICSSNNKSLVEYNPRSFTVFSIVMRSSDNDSYGSTLTFFVVPCIICSFFWH